MLTNKTVTHSKPKVSALGWFSVLRDFGSEPYALFDGLEPHHIPLDPSSLGFLGFATADLMSPRRSPESDLPAELLADLSSLLPARVAALNKSSNRAEFHVGYFAVADSLNSSDRLWIYYSFFEVSPGRYHCYIHALIRQNSNRIA
jgi:hypothetical protein